MTRTFVSLALKCGSHPICGPLGHLGDRTKLFTQLVLHTVRNQRLKEAVNMSRSLLDELGLGLY